jgi:hypothetical protein
MIGVMMNVGLAMLNDTGLPLGSGLKPGEASLGLGASSVASVSRRSVFDLVILRSTIESFRVVGQR